MLAEAQTAASAFTGIEVDIILAVGGALASALAAIGTAGVVYLKKKLNIDDQNQATAAIEATLANGLNKGVQVVANRIAAGESVTDVHAMIADVAHEYAAPKLTGAQSGNELQRAGIDPASLADRIAARATGKMLEPAVTDLLNTASLEAAKRAAG